MNVRFAMKLAAVIACVFVHTTNVYGQYSSPSQKASSTQPTTKPISHNQRVTLTRSQYEQLYSTKKFPLKTGSYTPDQGLKLLGITHALKAFPFPAPEYNNCYAAYKALVKNFSVERFGNSPHHLLAFNIKQRKIIIEARNFSRSTLSYLQVSLAFCHEVMHMYDTQKQTGYGLVIGEARGYAVAVYILHWLVQKFGLPKNASRKKIFYRIFHTDALTFTTAAALLNVKTSNPVQYFLDPQKLQKLNPLDTLIVYPKHGTPYRFARHAVVETFRQLVRGALMPALRKLPAYNNVCYTWRKVFPSAIVRLADGQMWTLSTFKTRFEDDLLAFGLPMPSCLAPNIVKNWLHIINAQLRLQQRTNIHAVYISMKHRLRSLFKKLFKISYKKYFKK